MQTTSREESSYKRRKTMVKTFCQIGKVKIFCQIGNKIEFCDVSIKTHTRLRNWTSKMGYPFHKFVRKAWQKYGVSEKAIKQYFKEK